VNIVNPTLWWTTLTRRIFARDLDVELSALDLPSTSKSLDLVGGAAENLIILMPRRFLFLPEIATADRKDAFLPTQFVEMSAVSWEALRETLSSVTKLVPILGILSSCLSRLFWTQHDHEQRAAAMPAYRAMLDIPGDCDMKRLCDDASSVMVIVDREKPAESWLSLFGEHAMRANLERLSRTVRDSKSKVPIKWMLDDYPTGAATTLTDFDATLLSKMAALSARVTMFGVDDMPDFVVRRAVYELLAAVQPGLAHILNKVIGSMLRGKIDLATWLSKKDVLLECGELMLDYERVLNARQLCNVWNSEIEHLRCLSERHASFSPAYWRLMPFILTCTYDVEMAETLGRHAETLGRHGSRVANAPVAMTHKSSNASSSVTVQTFASGDSIDFASRRAQDEWTLVRLATRLETEFAQLKITSSAFEVDNAALKSTNAKLEADVLRLQAVQTKNVDNFAEHQRQVDELASFAKLVGRLQEELAKLKTDASLLKIVTDVEREALKFANAKLEADVLQLGDALESNDKEYLVLQKRCATKSWELETQIERSEELTETVQQKEEELENLRREKNEGMLSRQHAAGELMTALNKTLAELEAEKRARQTLEAHHDALDRARSAESMEEAKTRERQDGEARVFLQQKMIELHDERKARESLVKGYDERLSHQQDTLDELHAEQKAYEKLVKEYDERLSQQQNRSNELALLLQQETIEHRTVVSEWSRELSVLQSANAALLADKSRIEVQVTRLEEQAAATQLQTFEKLDRKAVKIMQLRDEVAELKAAREGAASDELFARRLHDSEAGAPHPIVSRLHSMDRDTLIAEVSRITQLGLELEESLLECARQLKELKAERDASSSRASSSSSGPSSHFGTRSGASAGH
jgi:hypothetical protein